ncbi:MAG: capsid cement protein [Mycobacterium sp.]
MANDMVRTKEPGADVTGQVTAAVIGCRFLRIAAARTNRFSALGAAGDGNNYRVAHCAAGGPCFGVSKYDQATVGGKVGVARGGIVTVLAASALTAGQKVMSDATGQAVPWASAASEANSALGYAVDDAAGGALAEIALNLM